MWTKRSNRKIPNPSGLINVASKQNKNDKFNIYSGIEFIFSNYKASGYNNIFDINTSKSKRYNNFAIGPQLAGFYNFNNSLSIFISQSFGYLWGEKLDTNVATTKTFNKFNLISTLIGISFLIF